MVTLLWEAFCAKERELNLMSEFGCWKERLLNSPSEVSALMAELPPIDVAEVLASLDDARLAAVLRIMSIHDLAQMLEEWDIDTAWHALSLLPKEMMAPAVREMPSDDRTDLLNAMPEATREILLQALSTDTTAVRELLAYAAQSSGGLMATEFLAVRPEWTSEEALAIVRHDAQEAETAYYVYVTDHKQKLMGVLSLRELVLAAPQAKVIDIMRSNPVKVHEHDHQAAVADLFRRYHLFALPVVDDKGLLKGIVTADDVLDVVDDEATEDMQKMSWMTPNEAPYLDTTIIRLAKQRLPWLLVLMLSATFTGQIIKHYEDLLGQLVALTIFIPMLMDTAGNAGSQSSTLIIRGLALGEISQGDWLKVFKRELLVSAFVGLALAAVNFIRISFIEKSSIPVALVVSLTLFATVVLAKITGGLLPLIAKLLSIDPAIMAGPLITTIVDAMSLFIYFYLATSLLAA
ncbi:MAG TPA: magnesium transporter [Firmicutes bacterium]|nr:magnesium transporter [Bacillota bacterium]